MPEQEKQARSGRNAASGPVVQPNPMSLKDNPDGETVCSPYFSKGCINEDTDTTKEAQEDEDEKHESGNHLL